MKNQWTCLLFLAVIVFFFKSMFLQNLLPIPSDDLIGLYYPFRDFYAAAYPRGFPFKNFLVTDPVRQQYPWRNLAVSEEKKSQFPLWNPYTHAGMPLLANIQSAVFYPFNAIFLLFPFAFSWSVYIILGPLLGGVFFYLYVRNLRLDPIASATGAMAFALSGFMMSWMEWGIITHTLIWLPLLLLSTDNIFAAENNRKKIIWCSIFALSFISMFFAGHIQTFFYAVIVVVLYLLSRWFQYGRKSKALFVFGLLFAISIITTGIQWIPALRFILLSARGIDQNWMQDGWFIPWQHIVQFIAPDFFGNPATMNYWGVWNYGEFVGYIGIIPIFFAFFAVISRKDKKTLFYTAILFASFLFAFPTLLAKIPFILKIPFISTSQPTRIVGIIDFSLSVLAVLGLDYYKKEKRNIYHILAAGGFLYFCLWIVTFLMPYFHPEVAERASIAKHNLIIPTVLFVILLFLTGIFSKYKRAYYVFLLIIFSLTAIDLLRFADKFTPFTNRAFLFPSTKTVSFLRSHIGIGRMMETDKRIFPPNVSVMYHLQSVDGYDPLYLLSYGELIAAEERGKPDIISSFGFNRIITPENYASRLIDLMGVKYILSLDPLQDKKLKKVFSERYTNVYENTAAYPRIFFVEHVLYSENNKKAIASMFDNSTDLRTNAVIEYADTAVLRGEHQTWSYSNGTIHAIDYKENSVAFDTQNVSDGFLVLTDTYYPTWHAVIDGKETSIYRTDYTFRGIFVPAGRHHVVFYDALF